MRTISTDHTAILTKISRRVDLKVEIEDGDGTMQNMTDFKGKDWVISATWGEDIDTDCMQVTIELQRELFNDSLAPLVQTARTNLNLAGTYDPIINLERRVKVWTRYAPADSTADAQAWMFMFDGNIDVIDWGSEVVRVDARDKYRDLQDTFIETVGTYGTVGGEPLEDVIDALLTDYIPSPLTAPTLYTATSPGWNLLEFATTKQSLGAQISLLTDQIGWRCRFIYDSGSASFRLNLYTLDRAATTSLRTFTQDEYWSIPLLEITTKDIRNAVTVNGETRTDSTSITAYRRRWMGIQEDSSSNIDTAGEARDFADIVLNDLAYPKMNKRVEMPYFAFVELGDLYTFSANDIHYTANTKFAIVSYRHTITENECTTQMDLRETTVAGKHEAWFKISV